MKNFNSESDVKEFCKKNREQITSIVNETTSKITTLPYTSTMLEPALNPGKIRKTIFQILLNSSQTETSSLLETLSERLYDELYKEIDSNAKKAKINLSIGSASLHTIREPENDTEMTYNKYFDDIVSAVSSLIPQINDIPNSQEADIAILFHLQSNVLDSIKDSNLPPVDAIKENLLSAIRAEIELQKN